MDLRKLKTLIDLVSESNISELEITEADGKVRIVKSDGSRGRAHDDGSTRRRTGRSRRTRGIAAAPVVAVACRSSGRNRPHRQVADGRHLLSRLRPERQVLR